MPPLPLPADEAHVFLAWGDTWAPRLDTCLALLDEEERVRERRFLAEGARREFIIGHALARRVLARFADVDPRAFRFVAGGHGRLEIAAPTLPGLRFNLSHSHGLIACLVVRDVDAGVDVEPVDRRTNLLAVADRYFSPVETAALRRQPEAEQRARFFAYWTLKESYIKARGLGLAIPLHHFSFDLECGPPIRIDFAPALDDDPRSWQFDLRRVGGEAHYLATAIRRGRAPDHALVLHQEPPP